MFGHNLGGRSGQELFSNSLYIHIKNTEYASTIAKRKKKVLLFSIFDEVL